MEMPSRTAGMLLRVLVGYIFIDLCINIRRVVDFIMYILIPYYNDVYDLIL